MSVEYPSRRVAREISWQSSYSLFTSLLILHFDFYDVCPDDQATVDHPFSVNRRIQAITVVKKALELPFQNGTNGLHIASLSSKKRDHIVRVGLAPALCPNQMFLVKRDRLCRQLTVFLLRAKITAHPVISVQPKRMDLSCFPVAPDTFLGRRIRTFPMHSRVSGEII